jgi:DNA-binding NarL/FixJ family response regulator
MRVVLVGPPAERDRLRRTLASARVEIVGEALTLEVARAIPGSVDAFVVAPRQPAAGGATPEVEPLTAREHEVLRLLAEGLPNKAIASRLHISDQTVKFHVASIGGKLGARNRTETVRLAIRRGLVEI